MDLAAAQSLEVSAICSAQMHVTHAFTAESLLALLLKLDGVLEGRHQHEQQQSASNSSSSSSTSPTSACTLQMLVVDSIAGLLAPLLGGALGNSSNRGSSTGGSGGSSSSRRSGGGGGGGQSYFAGQAKIAEISRALRWLAKRHHLAVLVTNTVVSSGSGSGWDGSGSGSAVISLGPHQPLLLPITCRPSLGLLWAQAADVSLLLEPCHHQEGQEVAGDGSDNGSSRLAPPFSYLVCLKAASGASMTGRPAAGSGVPLAAVPQAT